MINFDGCTNENKRKHNLNWPYIPDHPHRILIIGGSGLGKTNTLSVKKSRHKVTKFWASD